MNYQYTLCNFPEEPRSQCLRTLIYFANYDSCRNHRHHHYTISVYKMQSQVTRKPNAFDRVRKKAVVA
jgi:hypothetical protein